MRPAPCPKCSADLWRWYEPALDDPDDAEPHAMCTAADCDYSY